jgi:hypothetical protein
MIGIKDLKPMVKTRYSRNLAYLYIAVGSNLFQTEIEHLLSPAHRQQESISTYITLDIFLLFLSGITVFIPDSSQNLL